MKRTRKSKQGQGVCSRSIPVWVLLDDGGFVRYESLTAAATAIGINPVVVRSAKARAYKKGAVYFDSCGHRFALSEPLRMIADPAPKFVAETLEEPAGKPLKPSLLAGLCTHRLGTYGGGRW